MKVTVIPPNDAVAVWTPGVGPSVQMFPVPVPASTTKVTNTPGTRRPSTSVTARAQFGRHTECAIVGRLLKPRDGGRRRGRAARIITARAGEPKQSQRPASSVTSIVDDLPDAPASPVAAAQPATSPHSQEVTPSSTVCTPLRPSTKLAFGNRWAAYRVERLIPTPIGS